MRSAIRRSSRLWGLSPNNRMQRAGHDKVHAPHCLAIFGISDYAPQGRRAVADADRWATHTSPSLKSGEEGSASPAL